jgi:hypothetical protein
MISRKTSESISILLTDRILKTLVGRYKFLESIEINAHIDYGGIGTDSVSVNDGINSVDPAILGKALESIIRVIYMDLGEKAGLFFMKELKDRLGPDCISWLRENDVDLELLSLEREYLRIRKQKRVTAVKTADGKILEKPEETSLIGYKWNNVTTWKYENNTCFLYDKIGNMLDKIQLDNVIEGYVKQLAEPETSQEEVIELSEDHFKLLKLLHSKDLDMDKATHFLNKTVEEIEQMVRQLLNARILQHIADDTVKITDKGIDLLISKEKEKIEKKK